MNTDNVLIEAFNKMLDANSPEIHPDAEHDLLEKLAFASYDEIMELLDMVHTKYILEFPVWAHLITYRMVCLLKPQSPEIRRRAAAWIRFFGPDWDHEADRLDKEARELEGQL